MGNDNTQHRPERHPQKAALYQMFSQPLENLDAMHSKDPGDSLGRRQVEHGLTSEVYTGSLAEAAEIRRILRKVESQGRPLTGRRTERGLAEALRVLSVGEQTFLARAENLSVDIGRPIALRLELPEIAYSLTTTAISISHAGGEFEIPSVLYISDRRDRPRSKIRHSPFRSATLSTSGGEFTGDLRDLSAAGVGIECRIQDDPLPTRGLVSYSDDSGLARKRWVEVRNSQPIAGRTGWVRIGLAASEIPFAARIPVETRKRILGDGAMAPLRTGWRALDLSARAVTGRLRANLRMRPPVVEVVEFANGLGERLRGIIDRAEPHSVGPRTAVIIPPAWGRTKETLLPLARVICSSMIRSGERGITLRFDGIRRRGESHNDPGCVNGDEHRNFTLSQAIDDIRTAVRFVRTHPEIRARKVILVTFSAASIEGRRSVQDQSGFGIDGWISVVGASDLQSGMRTVSGGVDYFGAAERGMRFGRQEIMGVLTDIDLLADDALRHRLVFLEDARRDMADVSIPVSWLHGLHDAWLDLDRVQEIMSCGPVTDRRLLAVPTGHQLQSSREAMEVFQLVAAELLRMTHARHVSIGVPELGDLELRRHAERRRLNPVRKNLQGFWKDYLLGSDGLDGIELMNATTAYRDLMRLQIQLLDISDGQRIVDVGCGTGSFPRELIRSGGAFENLSIGLFDYVEPALDFARSRLAPDLAAGLRVSYGSLDLDSGSIAATLGKEGSDAILASLVISYVQDPISSLRQLLECLRPGGRLVISSLKRDADISRLFLEGVEELKMGLGRERLGIEGERRLTLSVQKFLNEAARILDLQEQGLFHFWDEEELAALLKKAGFVSVETYRAFGDPEQAIVARGFKA